MGGPDEEDAWGMESWDDAPGLDGNGKSSTAGASSRAQAKSPTANSSQRTRPCIINSSKMAYHHWRPGVKGAVRGPSRWESDPENQECIAETLHKVK